MKASRRVLLGVAFVLIFVRNPFLLLHGRVMAEEGTTYLRYAWEAGAGRALLAPHQGYYSLYPNVIALAGARWVPLPSVGLLFTWSALLVQMLAAWIVIRCDAFRSLASKVVAVLVLILAAPSGETWLSIINSQVYLAICTAVIAISAPGGLLQPFTLCLAGITGPASCFLAPFLWFRAQTTKSKAATWQAVVLTLAGLFQFVIILRHRLGDQGPENWRYLIEACANHNVLLPFTTPIVARAYTYFSFGHPLSALILAILLLVCLGIGLWALVRSGGRAVMLLLAMGALEEAVGLFGGMGRGPWIVHPHVNGRYFVVFNTCLGFALVLAWARSEARTRSWKSALLGMLLLSGIVDFYSNRHQTSSLPDWRTQAVAWQKDSSLPIATGPDGWAPLRLPAMHPNLDLPSDLYDSARKHR